MDEVLEMGSGTTNGKFPRRQDGRAASHHAVAPTVTETLGRLRARLAV